ncbi:WD40-repeat-containing domain protein [Piptocephalis cylindrospora]|uniref:WD40-repeat-containing domain protein n=1 Tax=Piptocephalis cylindrospora TaxID=1907219 RepID=A0A4P9Y4A5_9FUNG|nr:WD40-repeat-containing domain protein [Piptocephalis cylindrospora]|eukprot:RKP13808.1 WD40-repeat-containing domain protein [Piptocephalis cylindrospora]
MPNPKETVEEKEEWEFTQPLSHALKCPICHDLLRAPLITRGCSHSFCAVCIHRSIQHEPACPLCRARLHDGDLHPNLALSAVCEEVTVWCPYRSSGCTEPFPTAQIKAHLSRCPYRKATCSTGEKLGCPWTGPWKDLEDHQKSCVYYGMRHAYQEMIDRMADLKKDIVKQVMAEIYSTQSHSNIEKSLSPDQVSAEHSEENRPSPEPTVNFGSRVTLTGHRAGFTSLASQGGYLYAGSHDGSIQTFHLNGNPDMLLDTQAHSMSVWALTYHPSAHVLVSGSKDGSVKVWDPERTGEPGSLKLLRSLEGHQGKVYTLDSCPSSQLLLSGSSDQTIRLWDVSSGECLGTLEPGHSGTVNALSLDPHSNGSRAYSASGDGTVRIWDVGGRQEERILTSFVNQAALGLAVDPDHPGIVYASTQDALIHVLDTRVPEPRVAELSGHDWEVWKIQVAGSGAVGSGGGGFLWSGSFDHTLRRWDLRMLQCSGTWREHAGYIHSVLALPGDVTSSSGYTLATACADRTVKLWGEEELSLTEGSE